MDALNIAIQALDVRSRDPKVRMIGLSDDLLRIRAALVDVEWRIGVLSAVAVAKHYGQVALHPSELEALGKMSDNAGARLRAGTHGQNCNCNQCWIHRPIPGK
jgi:hypothetical protein